PYVDQALCDHRVRSCVGQHRETVIDKNGGGFHQLDHVGKQAEPVTDNLELHTVSPQRFPCEMSGQNRLPRTPTPGRVRK
nr:hypothetical protein [Aeromicrobium sp.]